MPSAQGARVVLGGKRHALRRQLLRADHAGRRHAEMLVAREETFGPVAPLFRFKTEADVIAMANDTPFGLAAYFYARDVGRVWRVAEALECGIIGINEGIISSEVAPFGGVKESGLGREGSHQALEEFVEMKYMLMGDRVSAPGRSAADASGARAPSAQRLDDRQGESRAPEARRRRVSSQDGMKLGLGTGSTAARFVEALGADSVVRPA